MPLMGGGGGGGGGGGARTGSARGCSRGDPLRHPAAFSEHGSVPRLTPRPINQQRSELYRRVARADLYPPVLQEAPTWTQAVPFKVGTHIVYDVCYRCKLIRTCLLCLG